MPEVKLSPELDKAMEKLFQFMGLLQPLTVSHNPIEKMTVTRSLFRRLKWEAMSVQGSMRCNNISINHSELRIFGILIEESTT